MRTSRLLWILLVTLATTTSEAERLEPWDTKMLTPVQKGWHSDDSRYPSVTSYPPPDSMGEERGTVPLKIKALFGKINNRLGKLKLRYADFRRTGL
ncbi:hypothetical protein ON010_g3898 [Phytophthora cinnamomi]|nr:hypothetical protein ON010_g3898 [Phytophthora cinnamomi]